MSRKLLDGLEGLEFEKRSEAYVSGKLDYPGQLLESILETYEEGKIFDAYFSVRDHKARFHKSVYVLDEVLESYTRERFDPSALIAACAPMIPSIEERLITEKQAKHTDLVFAPLVQALYRQSYNDFHIDLTELDFTPFSFLDMVYGNEENPLVISCKGDAACVGWRLRHVELDYEGTASSMGVGARKSTINMYGPLKGAGSFSRDSTFTLDSVEPLLYASPFITRGNNTYFIRTEDIGDDAMAVLREKPFWYSRYERTRGQLKALLARVPGINITFGNTLYRLDSEGKWKEVIP